MQGKTKKLVIVGAGEFAEIAYEYFMFDSEYEVKAFAVEKAFITQKTLFNLPIVEFESVDVEYSPDEYDIFVAVTYVKLNRERTRLFNEAKLKGYHCASYISSQAFIWRNVAIGENTFIFEDNTIQYNVKIGNNVVLWSGNHIGHRTVIEDNCWLTSHDVVSGFCHIGKNSFIGVNATLGDNVSLPFDTLFGAGALTVKSLHEPGSIYIGSPAKKMDKTSYQQFGIEP
jgi:sugar O-acyltransferase, sialic acid O-acetyltransferase NeuD family